MSVTFAKQAKKLDILLHYNHLDTVFLKTFSVTVARDQRVSLIIFFFCMFASIYC